MEGRACSALDVDHVVSPFHLKMQIGRYVNTRRHSARASTWAGLGRGLLAPSAERETLPLHRGTAAVEPQQPTGAGRTRARAASKAPSASAGHPGCRADARAAQLWRERVLPAHPADRDADCAPAPRAQWRGWANTRFVPPSKRDQRSLEPI